MFVRPGQCLADERVHKAFEQSTCFLTDPEKNEKQVTIFPAIVGSLKVRGSFDFFFFLIISKGYTK